MSEDNSFFSVYKNSSNYDESEEQDPYEDVMSSLTYINQNLQIYENMGSKIGTSQDSVDHRRKINKKYKKIKYMFRQTSIKAKAFLDDEMARDKKNFDVKRDKIKRNLAEMMKKMSKVFRETEEKIKETDIRIVEETKRLKKREKKMKRNKRDRGIVEIEEEENDEERRHQQKEEQESLLRMQKSKDISERIKRNEMIINERSVEIHNVEKDIVEIVEVMKELQWHAHKQGEIVMGIEDLIDTSYETVKKGNQELRKANKYSKHSRTLACCIILVLLVIAVIIAVAFFIVAKFTFLK